MNLKRSLLLIFVFFIVTIIMFYFILHNYYNKAENKENNTINIVYTTDTAYRNYLKVSLKSAQINKKPASKYNITILAVDLTEEQIKEFDKLKKENFDIKVKPLKIDSIDYIGNYDVKNHVSRADLFKLIMTSLFKDYEKILYIDSDTLILNDLSDLYNTNIKNFYLAAVYKAYPDAKKYILSSNYILLRKVYNYNCGVLLYNLNKMRKNNIEQKLIEAKNSDINRTLMTQSTFNQIIPPHKIKKLSPVYNFITYWTNEDFFVLDFKNVYKPFLDNIDSYEKLKQKAVIVHFAGKEKPWCNNKVLYGEEWWKYAHMINPAWNIEKCEYK